MKGKALLSAMVSVFGSIAAWIVLLCLQIEDALLMAIFSGILFYLMLYLFLVIYEKLLDRRYKKFKKNFSSAVLHKTNGNFRFPNGKLKNGNIYFCEDGIRFAFLEEKPYLYEEIPLHTIHYCCCETTQISIVTKAARVYVATVPEAYKLRSILMEKGWNFPE